VPKEGWQSPQTDPLLMTPVSVTVNGDIRQTDDDTEGVLEDGVHIEKTAL